MTGGTKARYFSVLSIFNKDAQMRLSALRGSLKDGMRSFVINVHALKSAAAAIGAEKISEHAAMLENAGRAGDEAYIHANIGVFVEHLTKLIEDINYTLETEKAENEQKDTHGAEKSVDSQDNKVIFSLFESLRQALVSQKMDTIDQLLEKLYKLPLNEKTRQAADHVSDYVLITEFDRAIKTIDECMTNLK